MLSQSQSTCHRIIREDARGESSAVDPDSAKMPNPKVVPAPEAVNPSPSPHHISRANRFLDAMHPYCVSHSTLLRLSVFVESTWTACRRRVRASKPAAGALSCSIFSIRPSRANSATRSSMRITRVILPHQCQEKPAQVTTGSSALFFRMRKAIAPDFHVLLQQCSSANSPAFLPLSLLLAEYLPATSLKQYFR